jgi:FMN phosphatase YigB (HAD superfamily)
MKIFKILIPSLCIIAALSAFYKFNKKVDVANCQILESSSLEDVKKFIEPETLFIFDYDNVLIEGKKDYGFDAWFCSMLAELEKNGLERAAALHKLLPIYEQYQLTAEVQAVEPCAKTLIENFKNSGYNAMILTVRSLCLIDSVFKQLKSTGIDIEKNAISENGINSELTKIGSRYCNGILFCDGYYKGPALKAFLQGKPELKVKKIVFVDDKLKNLESVKSTAAELGIKFVGIRYGRTDERTKAFTLDHESKLMAHKILADSGLEVNRDSSLTGATRPAIG